MTDDHDAEVPGYPTWLEESAFPANLDLFDVLAKFWKEVDKLLPASELCVVDPYLLDDGGETPDVFAANVVSLLKPALLDVDRVVLLHCKPRSKAQGEALQMLITRDTELLGSDAVLAFQQRKGLHARYLVADRVRVLRMDFSYNRIGRSFGTVALVNDAEDLAGYLEELASLRLAFDD